MHFHLPKPLHGWRAFAGEVGIIVVGVLIALAAQQLVETVHLRQQTDAARDQLRQELQNNYVLADERHRVRGCLDGQIDGLEQRLLRSGGVLDPAPLQSDRYFRVVYRAPSRPWPAHVFDNVRGEPVYAQLSEQERGLLGQTYTQLHDMQLMNDDEDKAVGMLMVMATPLPLDPGVKAHLLEILETERRRADLMAVIASEVMGSAAEFGAVPAPQRIASARRRSPTLTWCRAHGYKAG